MRYTKHLCVVLLIFIGAQIDNAAPTKYRKSDAVRRLAEGNAIDPSPFIANYGKMLLSTNISERMDGISGLEAIQNKACVDILFKSSILETNTLVLQRI